MEQKKVHLRLTTCVSTCREGKEGGGESAFVQSACVASEGSLFVQAYPQIPEGVVQVEHDALRRSSHDGEM